MRSWGWIVLLFVLSACAPVATLDRAAIEDGAGGAVGLSLVTDGRRVSPAPYLRYGWGQGDTELGVVAQVGVGAYLKQRLAPGAALKVAGHLPGPAFEAALLADWEDWSLALRGVAARVDLAGDGGVWALWWGGSLSYWQGALGLEATVLGSEHGQLYVFSVAGRF